MMTPENDVGRLYPGGRGRPLLDPALSRDVQALLARLASDPAPGVPEDIRRRGADLADMAAAQCNATARVPCWRCRVRIFVRHRLYRVRLLRRVMWTCRRCRRGWAS